jgi:ABC-type lipoprotein export system ATPase subunit
MDAESSESELAEHLLVHQTVAALVAEYPYLANYFEAIRLEVPDQLSVVQLLAEHPEEYFADYGLTKAGFATTLVEFVIKMAEQGPDELAEISELTILGGRDKSGRPETAELRVRAGEVTCIVGPTGAGKSRLLEDIEALAQGDTPTRRRVLINGTVPSEEQRFDLGHRLVAQLTQNMNFVIDLPVAEFIALHAASRELSDPHSLAAAVIECANTLAGEPLAADTPVTQLSGGQSRALMIADTALVSASPIVLVDEIENAGIDRRHALDVLVGADKIVLMSTHDPILALLGDRRIVIENGGIRDVLVTSANERANLGFLTELDAQLSALREAVRRGDRLEADLSAQLRAGLDSAR